MDIEATCSWQWRCYAAMHCVCGVTSNAHSQISSARDTGVALTRRSLHVRGRRTPSEGFSWGPFRWGRTNGVLPLGSALMGPTLGPALMARPPRPVRQKRPFTRALPRFLRDADPAGFICPPFSRRSAAGITKCCFTAASCCDACLPGFNRCVSSPGLCVLRVHECYVC